MNITIGKRNIELGKSCYSFFFFMKGNELIANYIEHYYYGLGLCLNIRVVGVDRSNVVKL